MGLFGRRRNRPEDARTEFVRGATLFEQGDLKEAAGAFRRAIASGHPDSAPAAVVGLGNVLLDQGDLEVPE